MHVRDDPKFCTGHAVSGGKAKAKIKGKGTLPSEKGGEKGDILIQDLWTKETDVIHDMRVMNTDAVSYQSKTPKKFLETSERDINKKYLHACPTKY